MPTMQKLKHIVRKWKWLLLATALILITMRVISIELEDSFIGQAYVMIEYVPAQKRLTGKWPTDLGDLPTYLKSEKKQNQAYYVDKRLIAILDYHLRNYEKIEVIRKDAKNYAYILHLKHGQIECKSKINDRLN